MAVERAGHGPCQSSAGVHVYVEAILVRHRASSVADGATKERERARWRIWMRLDLPYAAGAYARRYDQSFIPRPLPLATTGSGEARHRRAYERTCVRA